VLFMSEAKRKEIKVVNELGLHARAAAALVNLTSKFTSDIFLEFESEKVNAKSIMGILTLAAPQGSKLLLHVKGSDAEAALNAVSKLFADRFGEER
jgi:phosphocarrier protein HPr